MVRPPTRKTDRAVVGAQVADLRAGAEVDPFADVGVAEEAVVRLVGVAVQDAGLDLAADAALRPDAAAAQFRTHDVAVGADVARPLQPAERLHHGVAVDQHRPFRGVEHHHRLDAGGRVDAHLLRRADDR